MNDAMLNIMLFYGNICNDGGQLSVVFNCPFVLSVKSTLVLCDIIYKMFHLLNFHALFVTADFKMRLYVLIVFKYSKLLIQLL